MFRKIVIAVDCENDEEQAAVQRIAQDVCQSFRLRGKDIVSVYPQVANNKQLLREVVSTISRDGKRGAISLIPKIIKML